MRFRSSILVTLTAAVIAISWSAATADAQSPPPAAKPAAQSPAPAAKPAAQSLAPAAKPAARSPAPAAKPAAQHRAPGSPSADCDGRAQMRACLAEMPALSHDPWTTDDARAAALDHKVRDDLPLAGTDDTPIATGEVVRGA